MRVRLKFEWFGFGFRFGFGFGVGLGLGWGSSASGRTASVGGREKAEEREAHSDDAHPQQLHARAQVDREQPRACRGQG